MRRYVIISIGAAITFVLGGIIVPLFQFLPFSALRAIILAPIYSCCSWLVLKKAKGRFTLTLFGAILGALLSIFYPWLFFVSIASAILSDLLPHDDLKVIMFPTLQLPMMWILTMGWSLPPSLYLAGGLAFALGMLLGYGGILIAKKIKRSTIPKSK